MTLEFNQNHCSQFFTQIFTLIMIILITTFLQWNYNLYNVANTIDININSHIDILLQNNQSEYFIFRNKTTDEIYNYSQRVNSELESLIQKIFKANDEFFEFINNATENKSRSICSTMHSVNLEKNIYYNNFNVSEESVMFSKEVTKNCTQISDRQLREHFQKIQNVAPGLHRKMTFQYLDNLQNNILTYPYFYDNYMNINKDINQSIILYNDYFTQYSMFFFFTCNDTTFESQTIPYQYSPYVQQQQQEKSNNMSSRHANSVFAQLVTTLADNTQLSATCYSNKYKTFKIFGNQLKSFTKVNQQLFEFIVQNLNLTSKQIRSDEFFQFIHKIVTQRLENVQKRIYVGQDPIKFTNLKNQFDYIAINKPCYIVINDMEFSDYMKNVQYNFLKFRSVLNQNVLKKTATYIMILKNVNISSNNTIYKYLRQFNYDNIIYTQQHDLFISNNFTISDRLIIKNSPDQMNQKIISICNKQSTEGLVYGVLCTNLPIEQILYKNERDSIMHEILLIDQLTFNFIYKSGNQINNYMYFLTNTIKNQNEIQLQPKIIAQHPDGMKYQFLLSFNTIQFIDITNDNQEVTFNFSMIEDLKKAYPPVDFDKINVCFSQFENSTCDLLVHIHSSDIPLYNLTPEESIYQQGLPMASYANIQEFYADIEKAIEKNITAAIHVYMSMSRPQLLTYYKYITQIQQVQPDVNIQIGRLYPSGIFSIYKYMRLPHAILDELRKFLLLQFGNYSVQNNILKQQEFYKLVTYEAPNGLTLYYIVYAHRKYIDFFIFPLNVEQSKSQNDYLRFGAQFHRATISSEKIQQLIKANIIECRLFEDQFGIHQELHFAENVTKLQPGEQFGAHGTFIQRLSNTDGYIAITQQNDNTSIDFNCSPLTFPNNLSLIGMEEYTKYINLRYGIQNMQNRESRWQIIAIIVMGSIFLFVVIVASFQLIK